MLEFEIVKISFPQESKSLIAGNELCAHLCRTGLCLINEEELSFIKVAETGVHIVPYETESRIQYSLLEVFPERINLRKMQVDESCGWSPKFTWLFKRTTKPHTI